MLKSTFRLLILISFLISVPAEAGTKVSYYINLGGIKISDTTLSVNSNNEVWNIRSEISAAGIVDVIIEFRAFSESRGFIKGNKLIPETYSFSYETGKGRSRKGTLSYDTGIPFKLITQPEYDVNEKPDFDFLKEYGKETNDPYSALFVSGEFDDPCTYTAHGFDGNNRWGNVRSLDQYINQIELGNPPISMKESLTQKNLTNELIGFGLRMNEGIDLAQIPERYLNQFITNLESAREKWSDVLILRDSSVSLTKKGMVYTDAVGVDLML